MSESLEEAKLKNKKKATKKKIKHVPQPVFRDVL
jgi:hypothetical protein